MEKRIAVLRGDGIGPEVVNESIKVLERVAQKFGHTFHYYDIIGGVAGLEAYGDALRPQDYELGRSCDSILFGSVGDPRKYTFTGANGTKKYPSRKEAAVKALASFRRGMELFANIRPAKVYPHNMRHLFARCFYKIKKDIAKLADVLGHSSIETTRIYIKSTGREHRRQLDRMRLVIGGREQKKTT